MTKRVARAAKSAKSDTDKTVGGFRQNCRWIFEAMQILRSKFPQKTALQLQLRTDANQRTAERWLSGESEISASALVDLLRSDIGRDVLAALMKGSQEKWWRAFERHLDISDLLRAQADQQRRLEQLQREVL